MKADRIFQANLLCLNALSYSSMNFACKYVVHGIRVLITVERRGTSVTQVRVLDMFTPKFE